MPQPRTPKAKAKTTGQDVKHPERFDKRTEPDSPPLGGPSQFMLDNAEAKENDFPLVAWEAFRKELPWLTEADRTVVEIASNLRSRLFSGEEVGVQALGQLRMCLSQMGATPADRSKVALPDGENKDPADKYFS